MDDYRALVVRTMSEATLLAKVRRLARLNGWLVYHTLRSKGSEHGWPDLVLIKQPYLLFVELKSEKGRVSRRQGVWLAELAIATEKRSGTWKPSQWEQIERTLTDPDAEIGRTA